MRSKLQQAKEQRAIEALKKRYFQKVPLSKLKVMDFGIDSEYKIGAMKEEITEHGLLQPVSVIGPFKGGIYKVIDGARRINAFRDIIKNIDIPCYVVGDSSVSEDEAKLLAYASNRVKRSNDSVLNLRYTEMVYDMAVRDKIPEHEMSGLISKLTGISSRMARKYISVVDHGSEKLRALITNGKLGIDEAYAIVGAVASRQKQLKYADIVMNTPRGAKKLIVERIRSGKEISDNKKIVERYEVENKVYMAAKSLKDILSSPNVEKEDVTEITELCQKILAKYQ